MSLSQDWPTFLWSAKWKPMPSGAMVTCEIYYEVTENSMTGLQSKGWFGMNNGGGHVSRIAGSAYGWERWER